VGTGRVAAWTVIVVIAYEPRFGRGEVPGQPAMTRI
jgi:hypothetical protein